MTKNELGTEIPPNVLSKVRELSLNPKYIYEDGNYGDKYPASNPGGRHKSTRFRNMNSANAHKFKIADNWVYFKSPAYANYPIKNQKEMISQLSKKDSIIVLNMPPEIVFDSNWHLMYGLTQDRRSALLGSPHKKESALNPKSEKFLTFFMLANLDLWQQPKCLKNPIRDENGNLNASFFKTMRENMNDLWSTPKTQNYSVKSLIPTYTDEMMKYSIFFFEHDIRSSAINPYGNIAFRDYTFLNITITRGWSVFDAFIFIPNAKRCIFIEAKLGSKIVPRVKKYIKISQITREMESAYLFTHHPDSEFAKQKWDYDYLFVCPRDKYENRQMDYSRLIPLIQDPNSDVLRNEYNSSGMSIDPTKQSLFEEFLSTAHKHIHVLFWDTLVTLIHENNQNFLSIYMNNLKSNKSLYDIVKKRFELASIQL